MNLPNALRPLRKPAKEQGFTWSFTTKGHVRMHNPQGEVVAVFGGTPSCSRAFKNSLADARRGGFQFRKGC